MDCRKGLRNPVVAQLTTVKFSFLVTFLSFNSNEQEDTSRNYWKRMRQKKKFTLINISTEGQEKIIQLRLSWENVRSYL